MGDIKAGGLRYEPRTRTIPISKPREPLRLKPGGRTLAPEEIAKMNRRQRRAYQKAREQLGKEK